VFQVRLKLLRESAGYSQYSFASEIGVAQSTVGMWESGRREPDHKTTQKLADFFDVTLDYLLGKSDTPNPQPVTPTYNLDEVEYGMINKIGKLNKRDKALISSMVDQLLSDE